MTTGQKATVMASIVLMMFLLLFPPWQQTAERETDYRKDIGRGFFLRPPPPVALDCYFVGCKTAPPSYFHVVLFQELFREQLAAVIGVTLGLLWIFRSRRSSLVSPRRRVSFSILIALLVPLEGTFPLASYLVDIPRQLVKRNELWLIPVLTVAFIFVVCTSAIYFFTSAVVWITGRLSPRLPGWQSRG